MNLKFSAVGDNLGRIEFIHFMEIQLFLSLKWRRRILHFTISPFS